MSNLNKQLLKSYIVRYDGNQHTLAEAMGIGRNTLSAKINQKGNTFKKDEMQFIRKRYNIPDEDFVNIFFAD